jgi:hypothetical protein
MADRSTGDKSEEDRLVNWGWGLGLLLPVIGLMVVAMLIARHDPRWPLILGWTMLGVLLYILVFTSV